MKETVGEMALQYYWATTVRRGTRLALTDGTTAEVLSPGVLNRQAGPDFSRARLRTDPGSLFGRELCGDVEMHLLASDWHRHGHHTDPAYASVALHVVEEDDGPVRDVNGRTPAQAIMHVPAHFAQAVETLSAPGEPYLRCSLTDDFIPTLTRLERADWMESLLADRFGARTDRLLELLDHLGGDWRQAAFATLARALGFGVNAIPMEELGAAVPLKFLERHSSSPLQLEAMLLGCAGLLGEENTGEERGESPENPYQERLCAEFAFLGHKYGLRPGDPSQWKMARTRPANFPHRRVAQLAAFCLGGFSLLGDILEKAPDRKAVTALFDRRPSRYWLTHHTFTARETRPQTMTSDSLSLLVLNTAVPLLFAYGAREENPARTLAAESLLEALPAEKTARAAVWRRLGLPCSCAAHTQALHHLYTRYCARNRCLECRWGALLLRYLNDHPDAVCEQRAEYQRLRKK